jgi:hypothetical protein
MKKGKKQYIQYRMFKEDTKQFYRYWERKLQQSTTTHIWKRLSFTRSHNEKADWIKREQKEKNYSMNWMPI